MGLGLSHQSWTRLLILGPAVLAVAASAATSGSASSGSQVRSLRSVLECGRNWSRHGAPLGCRLQVPVSAQLARRRNSMGNSRSTSSDAAASASSQSLPATVSTCDASTCRQTAFATRIRNVRAPGAPASNFSDGPENIHGTGRLVGIAEGSFTVPLESIEGDSDGATASSSMPLQLRIDIARLQLGAEVMVDTPLRDTVPSAARSGKSPLNVSLDRGSLQISTALPLLGPSPSLEARLRLAGDEAGHLATGASLASHVKRVHVEVGAEPPSWVQLGPKPDAVDLVVTLEPHLGRWARCYVAAHGRDGDAIHTRKGQVGVKTDDQLSLVLPLAVGVLEASDALLAHRSAGPHLMYNSSRGVSDNGFADRGTFWQVPTVGLQWMLTSFVPILAPDATEVSLVVRRSGTVGSAWQVLTQGLQPAERARLSRLTVEWDWLSGLCLQT